MDIDQIFSAAVTSIVGVFLAGMIINWQHARAERNWRAGKPISVAASIRALRPTRFGAIWRHGTVDVKGERVVWTPRTPWGRSVELGGVGFGSQRPPVGPSRFQLPPAAVVMSFSDADRGYELAVLPGSIKYIYGAQFAA